MPPVKRFLWLSLGVIVAGFGARWGLRRCAESMPSYQRARATVAQILFVQGRVLLRTEISEVFVSDDNGGSWRATSATPPEFAIANENEIWAAHGWTGYHEGPSASIWRSTDKAETWSHVDIELPGGRGTEIFGRLPAIFINGPADEPLLAMSDFQLVRPDLAADSSKWKRIGTRIRESTLEVGTNRYLSGRRYGRWIYVASFGHIFFSSDEGVTWADQPVHPFFDSDIRCLGATCYVLVNELGSAWSELLTTEAGKNDWTTLRVLDVPLMASVLGAETSRGAIKEFGGCAMVPTETGVYVAGIINAGRASWGAVVRVSPDGAVASVGHGVPEGLWVLERAPDGKLWAGGEGAYRLQGDEWIAVWTVTN